MSPRPLLVSVVAYGAANLLAESLAGLDRAFPVTVVDNSSDPQVRAVSVSAGADYRDPHQNLGFGAAHNLVLHEVRRGAPSDVLLLNPDAVITPDAVRQLQTYLHDHPGVGAVTPRLLGPGGDRQREMWPFPSPGRAWLEAIGLGRLNRAQDFAVGSVLLLRWELLQDTLFDERFFLYAEESDLQRSARTAGWRSALCETVSAMHVGAGTSPDSVRRDALFHAGTETHVRKWHGASGWFVYRAAMIFGSGLRGGLLPGARGASARRRARLYVRGPRQAVARATEA